MEVDAGSGTVFVEIRRSDDKVVSFGAVSLSTGKTSFKELITPERWFTGIETSYDGVLLLHGYLSESSPVHKGLIAVDGVSGETIWSNYTLAFDHLSVNGPVVFNIQIQPKKLLLADIKTGQVKRSYQPEIDIELVNDIVLPQVLPLSYLKQRFDIEPYGNNAHYLEYNNLIIVSLHSLQAGVLRQHLYIIDDNKIIYEDVLNDTIQKLQPEAFILSKNYLIYIKNKSELKVINL